MLNGTGKIQPKGGGELPFVIVELEQGKRFVDKTSVFGAGLVFTHTIEPTPSGTKFTHLIEAKGIMAWFYALILGRKMRHGLPLAMQELKKQAEEYERKDKK